MDLSDIIRFEAFLFGDSSTSGTGIKIVLSQKRDANSVRKIFEQCQEYMKWKHYKNAGLFHISGTRKKFTKDFKKTCPKFITENDFKRIINAVKTSGRDETDKVCLEIIYKLMFRYGMRIGEVLGLTVQDIISEEKNGSKLYGIIIRNRISDKDEQKAKTCTTPSSREDYSYESYYQHNVSYQSIIIDPALYDLINYYIEISREKFGYEEVEKSAYADDITGHEPGNTYIFINANRPTPKSRRYLERVTRKIMIETGCSTEDEHKSCHKFRHGFVMHLLYDLNMSPETAVKYTRHKNVSGLEPYNNPTPEQLITVMNEFSGKLNSEKIKEAKKLGKTLNDTKD